MHLLYSDSPVIYCWPSRILLIFLCPRPGATGVSVACWVVRLSVHMYTFFTHRIHEQNKVRRQSKTTDHITEQLHTAHHLSRRRKPNTTHHTQGSYRRFDTVFKDFPQSKTPNSRVFCDSPREMFACTRRTPIHRVPLKTWPLFIFSIYLVLLTNDRWIFDLQTAYSSSWLPDTDHHSGTCLPYRHPQHRWIY